jgi:peptide/nickel transport system substrate-binding protein
MANYLDVHRLMRKVETGQLSRRDFVKRTAALGFSVPAIASFLAACGGEDDDDPTPTVPAAADPTPVDDDDDDDETPAVDEPTPAVDEPTPVAADPTPTDVAAAPDDGEGQRFDRLIVALNTDLASLDLMWGTPTINRDLMGHVYEYLFTMGEGNIYIPDLAEEMDISDDGMTFTITLREGVNFHNGEVMTSEDVLASMERWERMTQRGSSLLESAESVEATDDNTIVIQFSEPNGGFLFGIGHYGGLFGVFPKAIIDEHYDETAEDPDSQITNVEDAIGTGPYMVREWVPDRSLILDRFEDYSYRDEPVDGRGGRRHAYADVIEFIPVPDATTRLNGLIAGEYHLAYDLAPAQYEQVEADDSLQSYVVRPGSKAVAVFNKQKGPFADQRLRQAALAATDPFEVMAGTVDNEEFYGAFASLAGPEWEFWYTEEGAELYETQDLDRARELIEESDYNGETLRWITTREFDYMYRSALVASAQWAEAGLNVELVVSDWPTVVTNRSDPDAYEIFSTGIGFAGDPLGTSAYTPNWPGWTTSPGVTGAYEQLITETDEDRRKELWVDLQRAFYEEVPYIQFGERYAFRAARSEVRGFTNRPDFFVWNVWLED